MSTSRVSILSDLEYYRNLFVIAHCFASNVKSTQLREQSELVGVSTVRPGSYIRKLEFEPLAASSEYPGELDESKQSTCAPR